VHGVEDCPAFPDTVDEETCKGHWEYDGVLRMDSLPLVVAPAAVLVAVLAAPAQQGKDSKVPGFRLTVDDRTAPLQDSAGELRTVSDL